jgi:hypothetical protein
MFSLVFLDSNLILNNNSIFSAKNKFV